MPIEKLQPIYDFQDHQIEKLRQIFPEVVKDGKVDFGALKEALGEINDEEDSEHYGLQWPGKKKAKKLAFTKIDKTLEPQIGEGINEDTTENIFIEGDNLEVLKVLQKSYRGMIKMIYIDPPYNTGNDFVYKDDFKIETEEYFEISGQVDNNAERLVSNPKISGRYHSNWLNMIYSRLKLARDLLNEEGVIFISIDDNELSNLQALCNEIFGEENFASVFVIKSNPRGSQSTIYSANVHEYVLCYVNNTSVQKGFSIPLNESMQSEYNLQDELGYYRLLGLRLRGGAWRREDRPLLYYPIYVDPNSGTIALEADNHHTYEVLPIKPSTQEDGTWRWSKSKLAKDKDLIVAKQVTRNGEVIWDIYQKDYLHSLNGEEKGTKPKTIWDEKEVNYQNGTNEIKSLFDGKNVFDFPKPTFLISRILEMCNSQNSIILDFFAGSGTTAHAVMDLNARDGGKRRFISIQLPEATNEKSDAFRNGYETISSIARDRISKVAERIQQNQPDVIGDFGFKSYKLVDSNFKQWNNISTSSKADLFDTMEEHLVPLKNGWTKPGLLTEIILQQGFPLDSKTQTSQQFTGNEVSLVTSKSRAQRLFVCLDDNINSKTIDSLVLEDTDIFVCLDSAISTEDKTKLSDLGVIKTI